MFAQVLSTPPTQAVLEFLLRNPNAVLSKDDILRNVWDHAFDGDPNIVEVYVGYLRRKVDKPFDVSTVRTVRGVGYQVVPS